MNLCFVIDRFQNQRRNPRILLDDHIELHRPVRGVGAEGGLLRHDAQLQHTLGAGDERLRARLAAADAALVVLVGGIRHAVLLLGLLRREVVAQRVAVGERLRARLAADAAQVVHRRLLTVGPTHQILRLRHLLVKRVGVLRRHLHRGRRAVAALEAAGTGGDLIQPDIRRAAADGFELHGQQLAAGIDRLSPVGKAPAQLTGAVGLVRGGQLRRKSAGGQCVISRAGGDADALEHIIVKLQMACKAADHGGPHIHRHGKAVLLRHSGGTGGQRQVAVLHRAVGHGDLGRLRHPLELLGHAAGRRAVARHHIGQIQRIGAGVLDLAHDGQHFRPLAGHACAALYAACAEVVGVSGVLIDAVSAVVVRPAVPQLR